MGNSLSAAVFRRFCGLLLFILALVVFLCPQPGLATTVRMQTSQGLVDVQLFDSEAPLTVANFLNYVNSGLYQNTFVHRSMPGFVIQGGGYTFNATGASKILQYAPVVNEFSPTRSNLRGTIAMAKVGNFPDSATSEWFFNLADNAAILDNQNGGFTVFGQVTTAAGQAVVDAIAALPVVDAGGAFTDLPLTAIPATGVVQQTDLVQVHSVTVLPPSAETSESDRIFNYLEAAYPQYISPATSPSGSAFGYYYRYYASTNSYVGTANGTLYYLGPLSAQQVVPLGSLAEWSAVAAQAGY